MSVGPQSRHGRETAQPGPYGRYILQEPLGEGGMGEVWKAFDPQLQRYVAIKVLHADLRDDPGFVARFTREAQFIASLHHPNIVQIHDFQFTGAETNNRAATAYMVMDYVEGSTLARYIYSTSRQGLFPPARDIVNLFTSISLAIDYAHSKGMIHRDIKPANILLDQRSLGTGKNPMGEPILTDFGIAKLQGTSTLAATRLGIGTPLYISPEQAQGRPGDARSDLYSLGVILYEMLTGIPPFRGDSPYSIMMQHFSAAPPPPASINPAISPALTAVILRSLAKDPDARFPSASAMTAALAEAFEIPVPEELRRSTPFTSSSLASETHAQPPSASLTPASASVSHPSNQQLLPQTAPPTSYSTVLAPTPPATGKRQRKRLLIGLVALCIIVLLGSGLGAFLLLSSKGGNTPTPGPVVGHVYFSSSGQAGPNSPQGLVDQVTIDLHGIPAPPAGKAYYAWLLGDSNQPEAQPVALGKVTVNQGSIHASYHQANNLLASTSRFLITAEDATTTPVYPATDPSARLYYAAIPATPSPADTLNHFSLLDHLRHLLAADPTLDAKGFHGGLDTWFLSNTQAVSSAASSARNAGQSKNVTAVRQQIVDILYYLDGQACVQPDLQGLPAGTPKQPENGTITTNASIGLLQICPQPIPGYIPHIDTHLSGIAHSPGATPAQVKLAEQITAEMNQVNALLTKVRQDAQQLSKMSDAQLLKLQGQTLLSDMATLTSYAYNGQTSAANKLIQPGAVQVHASILALATLDVTACPTGSSTNACV